jgi:AcrR family transcriptional regulator
MSTASGTSGRERLLAAAARSFATRPYSEVGVAEILADAGVKAPTLYHHFDDKEDLFVAWAEDALAELGRRLSVLVRDTLDPMELLIRFAETFATFKGLDILQTMSSAQRLSKAASRERIARAYFDAVYEPCCVALLNASDAGLLKLEDLGKMAGTFLMGALSMSPNYALPATTTQPEFRWWAERFCRAFS